MCGIVGYLGADVGRSRSFVERGMSMLAHRGPDDEGMYVGDGVALGFRRLSILDLTRAGHQPMVSPDERFTLVFNGEIYNHRPLRTALTKSWRFSSTCDAETLLAALAQHGPDILEDLVGMWAFALWDNVERKLLLSRDRYGQKPLYWRRQDDGAFVFASEIGPLLQGGGRPKLNPLAMAEFLANGNYGHLGEQTFFADVHQLEPGHWASVSVDRPMLDTKRYWRFPLTSQVGDRPFDATARKRFRTAFEEAVSSQLLSDVPVAATLSGGIDSSAVVGAMVAHGGGKPIIAFTAQATGSENDESHYVRAVGRKWGRNLSIESIPIERMCLSALAPGVIRSQEEPFGDPSIIAHSLIARAVREAGIVVLLGGQGADELLLGYHHYTPALLSHALRRGQLRRVIKEGSASGMNKKALARTLLAALSPAAEQEMRARSRRGHYFWLSPALKVATMQLAPRMAASGQLQEVWRENVEQLSLPHLLHYDDRNTMAHSIEGRMPFLDHRLADIVAELDPAIFLDDGARKQVLREACRDLLPEEVVARRDKVSFHTPLIDLLRAEIEWVQVMVAGEEARVLGLYDVVYVRQAIDAIRARTIDAERAGQVWRALAAMLWIQQFNVDCRV